MPKKPQVRATNHAHAALAQLGERLWPGMWKIQVRVTARVWTGTTTLLSVLEDGLNNYSGFSSKRISLSPFTKDFRGEEHLRVKPVFGRLGRLAEHSEFVKDKTRLGLGLTQLHSASVTPGQKSRTKTGGDCATSLSPAANHWELKEGLAPFTPRIDPVLQRLRERCAHLLPCGKTNTDASRNKKRGFQSRAETAAHQQQNIFGIDAKGAKGDKWNLPRLWSVARRVRLTARDRDI
ncbi:hypothetical protein NQZ68_040748 [Dissostichus eleginoides]|nr:hypothetical protein NQZ68_040748 [Dissostichus eleginoides]